MTINIVKKRSIAQIVEVKRQKTAAELFAENEELVKKLDDQFNSIMAEIKIINNILRQQVEENG